MRRSWGLACLLGSLLGCAAVPPLPDDLRRAQALEAERRDEEALSAYRAAHAHCSGPGARPRDDCGLAAFREAQLLEKLGRYPEAAAAFEAVRELTLDGRLSGRALVRAALLYAERLGRPDDALRLCRRAVRRWPDEIPAEDALRLLVRLRRDSPDLDTELAGLFSDLGDHEVGAFLLLYRAERAERDGRPEDAVRLYDDLWRRYERGPLRDDAAYRLAVLLRRLGRSAEAAERLERLQRTFRPALIVGHYNTLLLDDAAFLLGQIYLQDLHRPDDAIEACKGLLKRQPTSLYCDDALLLMAQAALQRQPPDRAEACRYLQRLRHDYPDGNMVGRAVREEERLGCGRPEPLAGKGN